MYIAGDPAVPLSIPPGALQPGAVGWSNLDATTQQVASSSGFRNRIMNGDFRVSQRTAGTPSVGTVTYLVDRWYTWQSGAACAVSVVGSTNWNARYIRAVGVAGNTTVNFGQRIEAANIMDLAGKVVTLSGYAIRTLGGVVQQTNYITNTLDNWASATSLGTVSLGVLPANVFTPFRLNFTFPSTFINGLQVEFECPNLLAGDYFGLADIQLEAGNNPAPVFERKPSRYTFADCQRYYVQIPLSLWPGNPAAGANVDFRISQTYPVPMRGVPTGMYVTAGTLMNVSTEQFMAYGLVGGGDCTGFGYRIVSAAAGNLYADGRVWSFDAEI